uniref:helix-turn-helix domain-containing protein n=1 Tax=Collinsella aerofaciens TaxID=74426 RepID=UPI003FED6040
MDSDAKLQILIEALSAAGASALAIDERGGVVISTMSDAALEQDIAAFVSERLARVGDGARLVMGHEGVRLSLTVRPTAKERGALWVVVAHEVRAAATHAGIEWLNADEVEARYASSTYGIVEDAAAVAAPVRGSYARGVPLMLEGELGAGQDQIAKRLYLDGPYADQPFVSVALDELTDRGWRHLLKSSESPLFQTGLTLCMGGWHAVGPQRLRELVSAMIDTALATRCHVVLTANDMPGGSESDQAAFVTERFACAVSVAPAIAEQGAASEKVARYLGYLADMFKTGAPMLSAAAAETLDAYRWPRNYLQLREVSERLYILVGAGTVERAVAKEVLAQEDVIKTATFGAPALESDLYILRPLADTERDVVRLVLQHLHGNRTRAAEVLGISRTTLWRLLKDNDR